MWWQLLLCYYWLIRKLQLDVFKRIKLGEFPASDKYAERKLKAELYKLVDYHEESDEDDDDDRDIMAIDDQERSNRHQQQPPLLSELGKRIGLLMQFVRFFSFWFFIVVN